MGSSSVTVVNDWRIGLGLWTIRKLYGAGGVVNPATSALRGRTLSADQGRGILTAAPVSTARHTATMLLRMIRRSFSRLQAAVRTRIHSMVRTEAMQNGYLVRTWGMAAATRCRGVLGCSLIVFATWYRIQENNVVFGSQRRAPLTDSLKRSS